MVAPTLWHDFPFKSPGSWALLQLTFSSASCVRSLRQKMSSLRCSSLPLPLAASSDAAQAPQGSPQPMVPSASDDGSPSQLTSWADQELFIARDRQDECMWHLMRSLGSSQDDQVSSALPKVATQLIYNCAGAERSYVQVVDAAPLMLGQPADIWTDLLSISDLPVAVTSAVCSDVVVGSHAARQATALKLRQRISRVPNPVRARVINCHVVLTARIDPRHSSRPLVSGLPHCNRAEYAFQRQRGGLRQEACCAWSLPPGIYSTIIRANGT
jgi:hypothetical protein